MNEPLVPDIWLQIVLRYLLTRNSGFKSLDIHRDNEFWIEYILKSVFLMHKDLREITFENWEAAYKC